MVDVFAKLFKALNRQKKFDLIRLQIILLVSNIIEVATISIIPAYISLISSPDELKTNIISRYAAELFKVSNQNDLIVKSGIFIIILLTFSTSISIISQWQVARKTTEIGAYISDLVTNKYLQLDLEYYSSINSSEMSNIAISEVERITFGVIFPALNIISKSFLISIIALLLIFIDPIVTLSSVIIFASGYILIYKIIRTKLKVYGKKISALMTKRYQYINEIHGSIRHITLLNKKFYFDNKWNITSNRMAKAKGNSLAISNIPKFIMEYLAFGMIISIIVYSIEFPNSNFDLLQKIVLFAVSGYKLLPAFQMIYQSFSTIQGNIIAAENINSLLDLKINQKKCYTKIDQFESLELIDICFQYPNSSTYVLKNVNMKIFPNQIIGLKGPSGSGKSTLIDIIMGLKPPTSGIIKLNGKEIDLVHDRIENLYGYAPQEIYFSDRTIAEVIAFAEEKQNIDNLQLENAITLSSLSEFLKTQKNGVDSSIGENANQISGGQKQRISLARSFYSNSFILILDEITSALDQKIEKEILHRLKEISKEKVIISIAHKDSVLNISDRIFQINDRKVEEIL